MNQDNLYAAVDLGSNSFHLLIGERCGDEFIVRERLKQKVQLLAGFNDGLMRSEAMERGVHCLAAFAQRLAGVPAEHISVMGTSALRQAGNRDEFLGDAQRVLGVPVKVISGDEEARLIDLGVADFVEPPVSDEQTVGRLVVDIGGGSTEFALSDNARSTRTLKETCSLQLGCVSFTDRFFTPADLVPTSYADARAAAVQAIRESAFRCPGVEQVIGTSGSIESIQGVLDVNGWSSDGIDRAGLLEVEAALADRRWVSQVGLPGLAPERVDIFPAGVAILSAVFEVLEVTHMRFVAASLLQGMLHTGDHRADSVQARTVAALAGRFQVDVGQADRVLAQVTRLVQEAARCGWQLEEQTVATLVWAARLHEIGLAVSSRSYHRHGAYLLGNAPMQGFSKAEQSDLALLVRGHRRSFPALAYRSVSEERRVDLLRAMVLLRLAVILERGHDSSRSPQQVGLQVQGQSLALLLPKQWLGDNVLSARELEVEARQIGSVHLELKIGEQ